MIMRKSLLLLMCMILSLATWGQDSTDGITVSDDGATVTVDLSKAHLSAVPNKDKVTSLTLTSNNDKTKGINFEDAVSIHDDFTSLVTLDMSKTKFLSDPDKNSKSFSVKVVDGINSSNVESSTTYTGNLSLASDNYGRKVPDGLCAGKTTLVTVYLPKGDGLNSGRIGDYAFAGCTSLETFDIGDNGNFSTLGNGAFVGCVKLKKIDFSGFKNSTNWTIGNKAFQYCTSLESVIFPQDNAKGPRVINYNAFQQCTSLTSISFPSSVTTIGNNAFNGCTSLTSVVIPNTVTSIGSNSFGVCSKLASVTLPVNEKFTTIPAFAFTRADVLTTIDIPSNITNIGKGAFGADGKLVSMTVHTKTPPTVDVSDLKNANPFLSIKNNAFNLILADDAKGQEKAYRDADGWKILMSKSIDETDIRVGYQNWGDHLAPANHVRLYLQRTFANGWNTIVLPFSANGDVVKAAFGDNVKIAEFTGAEGNTLHFTTVDNCAIEEGKPYIISDVTVPTTDTNILYRGSYVDKPNAYVFEDVNISNDYGTDDNVNDSYIKAATFDGVTMTGTFRQKSLALKNGYFIQNGNLFPVTSGTAYKTRGFRAWFETTASNAKPLTFSVDGNAPTSISKIDADKADNGKIYDLQGREVSKPVKGIYIKNGRKFIVK